jgi:hypothetical protein
LPDAVPPGLMTLSPRHAELESRMTVAALRYFEVTGTRLFIIPIPNTTPPLFVAAGERESIVELLTSGDPGPA